MFAVLGVASNRASKAPVCAARALFCHAPALVTQLGAVTVIAAVPLWPSLVAVIVAVPPATPVASPLPLTVAAAVLLLAHVTVRPVSVFPAASLVTAATCAVTKDAAGRSEEHTSELQSLAYLVCRLLLEKKKKSYNYQTNS